MSFLSDASRQHLKEILEYVESFDVPYMIDPSLIGCPEFSSHVVFEIRNESRTLAFGYRYSRLAKRVGLKKELLAVSATIAFPKTSARRARNFTKPRFYLVQLGFGAKMHSLRTLETLRKARIAVVHSLMKDRMQSQIGTAENSKIPYILIIGQKEAIEGSVVVRDVNTRVQETVPLENLASYIKKLK